MPFHPYSPQHWTALLIGVAVTAGILAYGRSHPRGRRWMAAALAFLNLSAYGFSQAAWLSLGEPVALDNSLPIHLCDLAAIIAGFALITRRPILCALTYFWGLAATMQALITPALGTGFPSWPFTAFFVQHFAIVAAALFLPLVDGWRPESPLWKTPLKVFGWSVLYQASSLGINAILGTNFGFTMNPPENPSLIDHLGPWPWYLFVMWPIAFGGFLLLALPFAHAQKR